MDTSAEGSQVDDDGPPSATVSVKGPGVEIVRPVDDATMAKIIALLFGAAPSPQRTLGSGAGSGGAGAGSGATGSLDPELRLGEFLERSGASTFPEKICAAGYHLIHFQEAESFDRDSIRTALVEAHEDLPANFSRDFANAASANLIAQKPGDNGKYFVPTTGRRAVESKFQDVPKPKRRAKSARRGNPGGGTDSKPAKKAQRQSAGPPKSASGARRRRATTPSVNKELNLRPSGKQAFTAFVDEKQPANNHDRNVVCVYWLREIAGRSAVSRDDVYTCYREIKAWKVPTDISNTLQQTGSKGWLDTSNADDIKLMSGAVNRVEHGLPSPKKW